MAATSLKHRDITDLILRAFYNVYHFGPEQSFKRKAFDNSRKGSLSWAGSNDNTQR